MTNYKKINCSNKHDIEHSQPFICEKGMVIDDRYFSFFQCIKKQLRPLNALVECLVLLARKSLEIQQTLEQQTKNSTKILLKITHVLLCCVQMSMVNGKTIVK